MKTLIASFAAVSCILITNFNLNAQAPPDLTLVTTVDAGCASHLLFEPQGELKVTYWDQGYIEVEVNVTDELFGRRQLKSLITLGIYAIESDVKDDLVTISMPGQRKQVSIDGVRVHHQMTFHLKVPQYTKILGEKEIPIWASRETIRQ
jgi:hypothetical protein